MIKYVPIKEGKITFTLHIENAAANMPMVSALKCPRKNTATPERTPSSVIAKPGKIDCVKNINVIIIYVSVIGMLGIKKCNNNKYCEEKTR